MLVKESMKICFVISSLDVGGAERVVATLANKLSKYFKVYILTWDCGKPFYSLNKEVSHLSLNFRYSKEVYSNSLKFNYLRILKLRSYLKQIKPTVVIGFIITNNILLLIASFGLKTYTIISERSDLFTNKISRIYFKLRRMTYWNADLLIFQTEYAFKLGQINRIRAKKNTVIPNPVKINYKSLIKKENVILYVGRLSKEKQVKDLIIAYSRMRNKDYKLWIVGDGEERLELEKYTSTLSCKHMITFHGSKENVDDFYSLSKIFVLPSSSEGFPNVLLESMNFNNLVICSRYSDAAAEIIQDHKNGFLYESGNVKQLTELLNNATLNNVDNSEYIINASKSLEKYSIDNISNLWYRNIISLIRRN